MEKLRRLRVPGDTLFASVIVALAAAVVQMSRPERRDAPSRADLPTEGPAEART